MDNLNGALKELQSAAEGFGIELGEELLPILTDLTKQGSEVIRALGEMDSATLQSNIAFVGTTAAVGAVITTLVKLGVAVKGLFVSLGPAGWLIAGLSLLAGAIVSANVYQKEFNEVNLESVNTLQQQKDALSKQITEYEALSNRSKLSADELARFVDINSELNKTANPEIIAQLKEQQQYLYEKSGLSNDELDRMVQLNGDIVATVPESNTVLTDQGNILLENTDAAREFNAEQVEMIRLELEAKKAKLEANMQGMLLEEKRLISEINTAKQTAIDLDEEEIKRKSHVQDLEAEIKKAKELGNESEVNQLKIKLAAENLNLQKLKEQRAEVTDTIKERSKDLDKVQEQIGKLDQVKQQMVSIELKQAGINAKKGEEMKTLENELTTLYNQRLELDNIKDSATRNTAEYRNAKAEIDAKIRKLEGVRSKIGEIIGSADVLNSKLGADINKRVFIQEVGARNYAQAKRAYNNLPQYHNGGLVGANPIGQDSEESKRLAEQSIRTLEMLKDGRIAI